MDNTSAALRAEADEILYGKGLLSILSEYGEPHISGSYSLDLMVWRDLDIYLAAEAMPEARFLELGGRLAELLTAPRVQFRNERVGQTAGLPNGLYWGVRSDIVGAGTWKIDIWCVAEVESRRLVAHCEGIRERLTPESRRAIVAIRSAPGVLDRLEAIWRPFAPDYPFYYQFLDEQFDRRHRAEQQLSSLMGWFATTALLLTGFGVFAMAACTSCPKTASPPNGVTERARSSEATS